MYGRMVGFISGFFWRRKGETFSLESLWYILSSRLSFQWVCRGLVYCKEIICILKTPQSDLSLSLHIPFCITVWNRDVRACTFVLYISWVRERWMCRAYAGTGNLISKNSFDTP